MEYLHTSGVLSAKILRISPVFWKEEEEISESQTSAGSSQTSPPPGGAQVFVDSGICEDDFPCSEHKEDSGQAYR